MATKTSIIGAMAPRHFNRNLACAIDIETSGTNYKEHEILQLAIIPLAPDFTLSKYYPTLELRICPENTEAAQKLTGRHRNLFVDCRNSGMERWAAVDYVDDWFRKLKLIPGKKIVPIGCNYVHDRDFLREFLGGPLCYDEYFRDDYRDVQQFASFINDMCSWHGDRIIFPKVNLQYLCSCLKIQRHGNWHNALADAMTHAEIYRRMMRYADRYRPIDVPPFDPNLNENEAMRESDELNASDSTHNRSLEDTDNGQLQGDRILELRQAKQSQPMPK